jgi:predicted ATPase
VTIQPGEFTRFIGRRRELSEVRRLLSTSRLVTLTGIGGAGKTRIARRLTSDLERSYRGGAWMVELADLLDPQLLGHTVAGVLGLQVQSGARDPALLTGFLRDRQALLTLDNCEHLSAGCAELVVELLEACPDLKVQATSRQPLGIAGEAIFMVPPLSVPDTEHLPPLDAFGQYESVTLFVERASAALPSFGLTPENAESVARLVNALEGVPLALELAAARIRVLSPEAMLERINDRYHLLSRGFRDAPARQQSLMASVDWSYDLCTPQERTLWSRLSVFTGGFQLDAAEAVCAGDGLAEGEILDLVASLLDKSVLVRDDDTTVRYRMLETLASTARPSSRRPASSSSGGDATVTGTPTSLTAPIATGSVRARSSGSTGCTTSTPTFARRWSAPSRIPSRRRSPCAWSTRSSSTGSARVSSARPGAGPSSLWPQGRERSSSARSRFASASGSPRSRPTSGTPRRCSTGPTH